MTFSNSSLIHADRKQSIAAIACIHCGLPVPRNRRRDDRNEQFCCSACEAVYNLLYECKLDEYYHLRDALQDLHPAPAKVTRKLFAYLDDPEFLKKYSTESAEGRKIVFYIEGVHCSACGWLIEKIMIEREHAIQARLDLGRSQLELIFDPTKTPLSRLAETLDRFGYTPHPVADDARTTISRHETRNLLLRIGIAGAAAANIMLLAIALYAGQATGMDPEQTSLFRWLSFALAFPVVTYSAWPFYRGAISGLRARMLHMDLPVSLGILATFAISFTAMLSNRTEVYYDSLTALIFLLLCGRLLISRATQWASDASETLIAREPKTAHKVSSFEVSDVPVSDLSVGDIVRVLPGESLPVDGELISDEGIFSEAHLTGESQPVRKSQGESAFAGSIVSTKPVDVRATSVGETTRLSKLAELMRSANIRRAPIVAANDRIAGYFTAGVLVLSVATFIVWSFLDPSRALWNTAAMLVVTCPCALALATPVAIAVAMGRAARKGMFVKGQDGIERVAKVRLVILDKTGTLTYGKPTLVAVKMAEGISRFEQDEIVRVVAQLEKSSAHPLATAFVDQESFSELDIQSLKLMDGFGLEGVVRGEKYFVGSEQWLNRNFIFLSEDLRDFASKLRPSGTVFFAARDGLAVAAFHIRDALQENASVAVRDLKKLGCNIEILSGDDPAVVQTVAMDLDIAAYSGGVTPEMKLARVEELEGNGIRVLMAGDGVNDAAALSCATAGVSAAESSDIARDAADIFISRRGPEAIASLIKISRRALKVIYINMGIALFYNLAGVTLAMAGIITPLVAAILMPISSATVLAVAVWGQRQ